MNAKTTEPKKRKLTNFEFSEPAESALTRIMEIKRWNKKTSVEMAIQTFARGLRASN